MLRMSNTPLRTMCASAPSPQFPQRCSITNGSGMVSGTDVTDISIRQTVLYSFLGGSTDGGLPCGGVTFDEQGDLYGTTSSGGSTGASGGYTESVLHDFGGGTDGALPNGPLIVDFPGDLYGTTSSGGSAGGGTIFELIPYGSGYSEPAFAGRRSGRSFQRRSRSVIDPLRPSRRGLRRVAREYLCQTAPRLEHVPRLQILRLAESCVRNRKFEVPLPRKAAAAHLRRRSSRELSCCYSKNLASTRHGSQRSGLRDHRPRQRTLPAGWRLARPVRAARCRKLSSQRALTLRISYSLSLLTAF